MSRSNPQHTFRPPPELDAQLAEYCKREQRGSVNEALIVLVGTALELWAQHGKRHRIRIDNQ